MVKACYGKKIVTDLPFLFAYNKHFHCLLLEFQRKKENFSATHDFENTAAENKKIL